MENRDTSKIHQEFEEEHHALHLKIRRTRKIQMMVWLICVALGGGTLAYIGISHYYQHVALAGLAERMLPLLMGITLAITAGYTIFIFLYFAIVRRIYHSHSVIHTRTNAQLPPEEHKRFVWHHYLRNRIPERPKGAFGPVLIIIAKVSLLFALILLCQYAWMEMMALAGHTLRDEDYAYLGVVDLTLFSSLILFAVLLLSVRIGALGRRTSEHKRARDRHPPEHPERAR